MCDFTWLGSARRVDEGPHALRSVAGTCPRKKESPMRLALFAVPAFALAATAACSGSYAHEEVDDHSPAVITLEGAEIPAQAGLTLEVPAGFERLGLLWDATEEGALEIR